MTDRVVAVLGRGLVPADTPVLRADDRGVLHGDGVFETMHVRAGAPWLLAEHLARMARSADLLDLALPDADVLTELATSVCQTATDTAEAMLRLVCTRGPEGGGEVTAYATWGPVPPAAREVRRTGISVVTSALGIRATAGPPAPYLLHGAKSLSYAVNMAAHRWARQRGADDLLWLSDEGFVLEGPTSNLVWVNDGRLCTVPATETGILPGITVRWLLEHAGALGLTAAEQMVRPEALLGADGVWLTSSVRGAVAVRSLDGVMLPPSPYTAPIQRLLGHPVEN